MPYNPQVQYRGDQYLFQGISGAGQAIAEGISKWRRNKEEKDYYMGQLPSVARVAKALVEERKLDPKVIDEFANFPKLSTSQMKTKLAGWAFEFDQAQKRSEESRKAADSEADNRRADESLKLQQQQAQMLQQKRDAEAADADRTARFGAAIAEYMRPQAVTVAAGLPTIGGRKLTAEVIAEMAARHRVDPLPYMKDFLANQDPKAQFRPQRFDLGNGLEMVSTSPNSAVVVRQPTAKPPPAGNYEWVLSDDSEIFAEGLRNAKPEEIKEILARRNGFNRAMGRNADPLNQIVAELLGGKVTADATGRTASPATSTSKPRRFNPKTGRLED